MLGCRVENPSAHLAIKRSDTIDLRGVTFIILAAFARSSVAVCSLQELIDVMKAQGRRPTTMNDGKLTEMLRWMTLSILNSNTIVFCTCTSSRFEANHPPFAFCMLRK
jgi:hypothetical protein